MSAVACLIESRKSLADAADEQAVRIGAERVLIVRELLSQGRYCVEDRLDAVLDRILEELLQ